MNVSKANATSPTPAEAPPRSGCHGFWYDAVLVVPAVVFVAYLGYNARRNVRKLWNGRSFVMISYYALLWLASCLNLLWSFLQAWQCSADKEVAWNFLSLFTGTAILCLEISIVAFLLQDSYTTGLETLARTFIASGIVACVDMLFKAIYVFGFKVPIFLDGIDGTQRMKWGLWIIHKLLLAAVYGYILFVHFSKWREKLPRKYASACSYIPAFLAGLTEFMCAARPAFYNYIVVMFVLNAMALLACAAAGMGAGFGIWLYNFTDVCYHSFYLPFLYVTFLADFFQEEDFLLDNAYYAEMRDAGFFDADWD